MYPKASLEVHPKALLVGTKNSNLDTKQPLQNKVKVRNYRRLGKSWLPRQNLVIKTPNVAKCVVSMAKFCFNNCDLSRLL